MGQRADGAARKEEAMALNNRLLELIERLKLRYDVLEHREAFTARQVAETTHVSGRLLAKPVVIREEGGRYSMAVVSAGEHVDLAAIHHEAGRPKARLAEEIELAKLFPDCEVGAMPPVGRLWGLPTYLDVEFRRHEDIYFQAGNHREVVRMKFADFEKLIGPLAGEFTLHREPSKLGG
jgi:Ala-tRNA(Pro) deacylase